VQNSNFIGSSAPGAYSLLVQYIEGVRRLANKTVTVSFWANATSALKLGVSPVQVFGTGGSAPVNINGQAVTLSTTWARYSVPLILPSISSWTVGTAGDSTALYFWYSAGSTNAAQSGGVGQQSGTVNIWGVQLEVGSVATPLEKPDPQTDLAKCQRFYFAFTGVISNTANAPYGGYNYFTQLYFPTSMRAAPTIAGQTFTGIANFTTTGWQFVTPNKVEFYATSTAGGGASISITGYTASADL
jgi:hypothetical protein